MRNDLLIAVTALLGSASAGVHQMKLQKIPLAEQLAKSSVNDHARALAQKCVSYCRWLQSWILTD